MAVAGEGTVTLSVRSHDFSPNGPGYLAAPTAGRRSLKGAPSVVLCGRNSRRQALAAIRYFERNRAACGPPGLLSEEYDVIQHQLRGNLPQAFVHALLLECAATLTGSERDLPEISAAS
jgi:hypothetical protein